MTISPGCIVADELDAVPLGAARLALRGGVRLEREAAMAAEANEEHCRRVGKGLREEGDVVAGIEDEQRGARRQRHWRRPRACVTTACGGRRMTVTGTGTVLITGATRGMA